MKNISIEKKKARFVLIVVILTMLLFCLFVTLKVFAAIDWNRTYNFKINDDKGGEFTISWGHCHDAYIKGSTLTTAQMKTEVIDHFKTGGDCPDCSGTEFTSMTISGKTASVSGSFRRHTPFLKVVITKYPTGYRFAGFKEPAGGVSEEMFYAQDGDTFYIDCGAYTGAWYNRTAETNQGSYLRANNSTSDLTANWVANTYTIEYNGNGNTGGSTSSSSHTYDVSKELTSNGFTKTGYVFDGWNTKQDGSGTNYSDRQSVKNLTSTHGGKVILYAKWKKVTYRITYVLDSYSLKMIDSKGNDLKKDANGNYYIEGDYNTTTELVQVVPKNNYVFSHNYNDISGTFYDNPTTWKFVSDRTIYMYCKPATYRITYILDNNSSKVVDSSGKELSKDSNGNYYVEGDYNSKTDNLTVVPKTGYHFSYTENSLSGKFYNNPEWWNITGNRTIYAYCDPNQYTITFNPNGGSLKNPGGNLNNGTNTNSVKVTYNAGNYWAMNGDIPTATGHTFMGWYTSGSNQVQVYNASGYCTNEGTYWKNKLWVYPGNVTLYALWTPNDYDYTVNHYLMDLDGVNYTLKDTTTGKAQYGSSFVGIVNTYVGFTSPSSQTITIDVENNTINYYYTRNKYTLTLEKSAGISSVSGAGTYYYGATVTISATASTGYHWSKWTGTYTSTTNAYSFTMPTNDVSMTANATANSYTVVYDKNKPSNAIGSVSGTMNNSSHTYNVAKNLTKNDYSIVGYKFVCWNTKKDGSGTSYSDKQSVKNLTATNNGVVTLYAQWKHDDSGVGTLKAPTLKVNNPTSSGIYYNNGVYFVKGDGKTIVELYGEATLDPMVLSRVDKIALNYVANPLKPTYEEKYSLLVPKEDVWNLVYNKDNLEKYNTYTGDFKTYDEVTIVDIKQEKLSFIQKFTITGKTLVEPYVSSRASCMIKHDDGNDSIHDLYTYGNSIRLHSDPTSPNAYIIDESGNEVGINAYDNKWTNESNVTIVFEDIDSGIKSYKLTQGTNVVTNVANTTYTTKNSISLELVEGTTSYTLYVVDNVGNEATYTFTINVDRVAPSIEDLIITQGRGNVYTGNANKDSWPLTSKSTTWEYNWEVLKALKYKAFDDKSGLKLVKITHYGQDGTYTNVWKSEVLVDVSDNKLNMEKEKLIEEFNGDTYFVDGKNYLLIEVEDVVGNKTSVKLVVRRDKSPSKITNLSVTPVSLESYTIEELNNLFSKGDMSKFKTNVKFSISENISTSDASGIKTIEIIVKDPSTNAELKRYDVTSYLAIGNYTLETSKGNSRFSPLIRSLDGTINVNLDTLGEFPKYSELKVYVETTDYVGNKQVVGGNVFTNYSIKTTIYNTKDNAYNVSDASKKTNTPYFKTGEVGFIEIWSVGYVDKLELDFSEGGIGKEMNDAIANGQMDAKYKLGVHGALPNQTRFIKDLSAFKVTTSYPDIDGVSFASHISYTFSEVNNSMGASGIDGWNEKGTMIRIPTNHELVALNKLDKYGNELYKWETHLARIYPYKEDVQGNPSGSYYTIWDNSLDDLHYRILHLFLGY